MSDVASERLRTSSRLFAYTRWDAVPVLAAISHCLYFFALFWLFSRVPLWVMLPLGFIYSVSISWNINGISHNFIHNPYFRSSLLNRLFSIIESITVGFSQVFYECIHMQHHKGNADRPDDHGHTIDWISIYKHGEHGEAEHPLKYHVPQFLSRRSQNGLPCAQAQGSARSFLGRDRACSFCWYLCLVRYFELALPLFPSPILVFRALSFLPERLLPALRWKS